MLFRSHKTVCLLFAVLVAGFASDSRHASGEDQAAPTMQQSDWETQIEAALDAKGDWAFENVPLREVRVAMQEKLGIWFSGG